MGWFKKHLLQPSTHQGNTSCSTKARMSTNPGGLSIKLHILTVQSHPGLSPSEFQALSLRDTKGSKWILPQRLPKHCLSSSLEKAENSRKPAA